MISKYKSNSNSSLREKFVKTILFKQAIFVCSQRTSDGDRVPPASLVQHVRTAVGALDDVSFVGRQPRGGPRPIDNAPAGGGQCLVETADR